MTDETLTQLAHIAGISTRWKDMHASERHVSPDSMRAVLRALGFPADNRSDLADSLHRATTPPAILPPLVTAAAGEPIALQTAPARTRLILEDGRRFEGLADPHETGAVIPAILEPGYHNLTIGDQQIIIAVSPQRCFSVQEAMGKPKGFGLSAQLYALRHRGDAGLGDFASLAALAGPAARAGAQAIAISPVHAQFSADVERFSPYSPSSRTALNVLHAPYHGGNEELEKLELVDWPAASALRLAAWRNEFKANPETADLAKFEAEQGKKLLDHAIFETLHAHFYAGGQGPWHWRDWPAEFRHPMLPAVRQFAKDHARDVAFHLWLQYRADGGLAAAQQACKDAGMSIGLISDLAVGTDSGGSQCWSRPLETLIGLTVGAPPDFIQPQGQNWGLTAFSPTGMRNHGFATYREMLHTALAHAGGVRIDHAMGLNRLWVIPEGAEGTEGAYLAFPERDLMRLVALESHRHKAVILAEDLGIVPEGFSDRLRDTAILGLRVLWFERSGDHSFKPPAHWTPDAVAMTSTHDVPTLAGWWTGNDLAWRARLGALPNPEATQDERATDRTRLWQAFQDSGAAQGDAPMDPVPAVDAALRHTASSACAMVLLPLDDVTGATEQPNIPGTTTEHPNWRRRFPASAEDLLNTEEIQSRLAEVKQPR